MIVLLLKFLGIEFHLGHGPDGKPERLFRFVELRAGVVLDHLVDTDDPDGVDQPFEVDRNGPAFTGVRVLRPLHRKRHPAVAPG